MEKTEIAFFDSFSFENSLLSYRLFLRKGSLILLGEEFLKGERVYFKEVSFSLEEKRRVCSFYKILVQSHTYPQMIEELLDEFFGE